MMETRNVHTNFITLFQNSISISIKKRFLQKFGQTKKAMYNT